MFDVRFRRIRGIVCLRLMGTLDATNSPAFEDAVRNVIGQETRLIVDAKDCDGLTDAGVVLLTLLRDRMAAREGQVVLADVPESILRVLTTHGLLGQFAVAPDAATAAGMLLRRSQRRQFEWSGGGALLNVTDLGNLFAPLQRLHGTGFVRYEDLGFSIGVGRPSQEVGSGESSVGLFVTLGRCAGFISLDGNTSFRLSTEGSSASIDVDCGVMFGDEAEAEVRALQIKSPTLDALLEALFAMRVELQHANASLLYAMVADETPSLSCCLLMDWEAEKKLLCMGLSNYTTLSAPMGRKIRGWGMRFELSKPLETKGKKPIRSLLKEALSVENLVSVAPLSDLIRLKNPTAWLFAAGSPNP
jgi:anti-anti-sigma factor